MATSNANYGSVEEEVSDQAFDERNTYYLKEAKLTREQKLRKLSAVAVPILAAILLVGGAALYLLKDFNILYPGRGGGTSENGKYNPSRFEHPSADHIATEESNSDSSAKGYSPTPPANEKKDPSDVASACAAHTKCKDAGLVGLCCPTLDDKFLGCCN